MPKTSPIAPFFVKVNWHTNFLISHLQNGNCQHAAFHYRHIREQKDIEGRSLQKGQLIDFMNEFLRFDTVLDMKLIRLTLCLFEQGFACCTRNNHARNFLSLVVPLEIRALFFGINWGCKSFELFMYCFEFKIRRHVNESK